MTIYGTRPEAIKVAPVIKALEADDRFESIAVITGQHREMLDQVNTMFGITPDEDLDIMRPGQSLNGIVSRAIAGLDELLAKHEPDAVIVQGDTSTAMAGGLAAFNRGIRVVHVEAGLRTGNIDSPFPEEGNRRILTPLAKPAPAAYRGIRRQSAAGRHRSCTDLHRRQYRHRRVVRGNHVGYRIQRRSSAAGSRRRAKDHPLHHAPSREPGRSDGEHRPRNRPRCAEVPRLHDRVARGTEI